MGMVEYEEKLALAEKKGSFTSYMELLAIVRKEKLRVSRVVVRFGRDLLEKFKWRLGTDSTTPSVMALNHKQQQI